MKLMVEVLVGLLTERRNSLVGFADTCYVSLQIKGATRIPSMFFDLKNRLDAYDMVVWEISHMLRKWENIILIMGDRRALCIGEKDMESKLDMLFKKNLYTVAEQVH